jgi:hypothetical protein
VQLIQKQFDHASRGATARQRLAGRVQIAKQRPRFLVP